MEYILLILVAFGAAMLTFFSGFDLATYRLAHSLVVCPACRPWRNSRRTFAIDITLINLIIGLLLIIFAVVELNKGLSQFTFGRKALPFGGALSGFFGGLSGHQGALRSMFLIKAGLSKEGFIATGIVAAVVIDISRLSVYGLSFFKQYFENVSGSQSVIYVITACLAAFAGSYFGRKFLKKVNQPWDNLIGLTIRFSNFLRRFYGVLG